MSFKDSRNGKKRSDLKKEKWVRKIEANDGLIIQKHTDCSNSDDEVSSKSKFKTNLIANPSNIQNRRRFRSESPPSKKHRTKEGINRGKPSACSFCKPEIHHRMTNTSLIRSDIRKLEHNGFKIEDDCTTCDSDNDEEYQT